jgi:hypothetical protein
MSKRHFSILFLITVVVAVAVFLVPSRTGRDSSTEYGRYLPELAKAVNDLSLVRVSAKGGTEVVTLERVESGWVVQESHDYPADWSVLRPLLANLSQAVVVEEKTSNPEYYHRLGVGDPDAEDSQSKLVEFPDNESLPAVIVGNSAQNREGQYLRIQGEASSVLVDRSITLPLNSSGWMARDIIDVADSDVVTVRVSHADGEVVEIERESTDVTDFALRHIPEGREVASTWTVNQLASVLSGLQLESVAPVEQVSWEGGSELLLRTQEGLQIDALLVEDEEHRWLRLEASGVDEADAINERVSGWAYSIPLYKYDSINKRTEDLLAAEEDESE